MDPASALASWEVSTPARVGRIAAHGVRSVIGGALGKVFGCPLPFWRQCQCPTEAADGSAPGGR